MHRDKNKNLGNIGLDIETDLREFEKENSSRRICEDLKSTTSEQQQGTSASNVLESKLFEEICFRIIRIVRKCEQFMMKISCLCT
jgi:hypothetical protein